MQAWSLGQLQTSFGSRTGQSLYNYCRGIDDRPVKSEHLVSIGIISVLLCVTISGNIKKIYICFILGKVE